MKEQFDGDENNDGNKKRGRKRPRDRKKHNELEAQRRQRMNDSFTELAGLCGMENPDSARKPSVLKAAISKLQKMETILRERKMAQNSLDTQFQKLIDYKARSEHVLSTVLPLLKQQIDYHSIFNASCVAEVLIKVDNGQIIDCNSAFTKLYGYSKVRCLTDSSLNIYNICYPLTTRETCAFLNYLFKSESLSGEATKDFLSADGRVLATHAIAWITKDTRGNFYVHGIMEPVDDHTQNDYHEISEIQDLSFQDIPIHTM